ncbi:MAG TPA: phenylalanine--tRNA ligase subunit alpha [Bacteroidales bacterium]|nr:phenylalanine--tRNA ligase subunit alpha [Bacteroidales bacterium]
MLEKIEKLKNEVKEFEAETEEQLEAFRLKMLSKNGEIPSLFKQFRDVPADQKKEFGQRINQLKQMAAEKIDNLRKSFADKGKDYSHLDLSRPGYHAETGTRHPLALVRREMIDIFQRLGYVIADGPEIEDDEHNFGLLNFPPEHPARDMQDTFFIEKNPDVLLRTHTSSSQAHEMQDMEPPIRSITPGRVFRNEAISARAHCQFHQIEGLYVDKGVSFADLKQTLLYFAREFFGETTQIRLRPSYFPFTEPSAEMDVSCSLCGGKGCNVCKYTGWLEILGCGMVDPNVLESADIDPDIYSGFAFGLGIERIAMLKYGINDLRLYFENDKRFLEQFKTQV